MKHLTLTAVSLLLIGLTMGGTAYSQVPVWEREALIALYNATDGDNWVNQWGGAANTGWLGDPGTECDWYGVECTSGVITKLQFYDSDLKGSIPAELGNLSSLQELRLVDNQLSGSIPPELSNLSNLKRLYLQENQLSGSIPPELGNMSSLEYLWLHNNQLSGSIPSELGVPRLHQLKVILYLYNNYLRLYKPSYMVDFR